MQTPSDLVTCKTGPELNRKSNQKRRDREVFDVLPYKSTCILIYTCTCMYGVGILLCYVYMDGTVFFMYM